MSYVSRSEMVERWSAGAALVSFPTDTVPALAARPENAELIYAAKQRSLSKPLILMGASFADLSPYISGDRTELNQWRSLTNQHWPGQLTLVLPASDRTPATLNPAQERTNAGTLGIRVPNHPVALDLLARTGPLATTSANLSGQPALTDPADIAQTFSNALVLSPEAFAVQANSGTPATVVKWTGQGWQVLRQGQIELSD